MYIIDKLELIQQTHNNQTIEYILSKYLLSNLSTIEKKNLNKYRDKNISSIDYSLLSKNRL